LIHNQKPMLLKEQSRYNTPSPQPNEPHRTLIQPTPPHRPRDPLEHSASPEGEHSVNTRACSSKGAPRAGDGGRWRSTGRPGLARREGRQDALVKIRFLALCPLFSCQGAVGDRTPK